MRILVLLFFLCLVLLAVAVYRRLTKSVFVEHLASDLVHPDDTLAVLHSARKAGKEAVRRHRRDAAVAQQQAASISSEL